MGEGKQLAGESIVVFDNDGYYTGVSIAEKLAEEGKKVTLMTALGNIGPYMHFTLEAPNQHRRLHKLGVEIVPYHLPTRVEPGAVRAVHVYDEDGHEKSFAADGVVWVSQRRSNEALFRELKDSIGLEQLKAEGVSALYRVGDCEAPRLTADAIFSAHRLAREIDTADPSIPLPFKRERRLVEASEVARERAEYEASLAGASAV
jgi:dimethylamine/trimethylamine dehydrogenase